MPKMMTFPPVILSNTKYNGTANNSSHIVAGTYFINRLVIYGCIESMIKLLKNSIAIIGFILAKLLGIAISFSKSFITGISTPNP